MSNIVILGTDFAALAAAARLAVKGHTVTVVGELTEFEQIPNLITLPATLRDLFIKTGTELERHVVLKECDEAYRVTLSNGKEFSMPGFGVMSSTRAIERALGTGAAKEWAGYMQIASDTWELLHRHFEDYRGFNQTVLAPNKTSIFKRKPRGLTNPLLISIRDASPFNFPGSALNDLLPYVTATFGVFEVQGGLNQLAKAMQQRCLELRVKFQFEWHPEKSDRTGEYIVVTSLAGVGREILAEFAKPHKSAQYDMVTRIPRLFTAGAISLPGPGIPFEISSGAMVANLIGPAKK